MEVLRIILPYVLCLLYLWQVAKLSKENKQLHERVDILQQQLIEALNKDVKYQDNFSTDPVE